MLRAKAIALTALVVLFGVSVNVGNSADEGEAGFKIDGFQVLVLGDSKFLRDRDIHSLQFTADGKRIFSSDGFTTSGTMTLWDVQSGTVLRDFSGGTAKIQCAALSPDETLILSGDVEGRVRLWNAETGALLKEMEGACGRVHSVAFSPDGKLAVSGSGAGALQEKDAPEIMLWDVMTGKAIGEWMVPSKPIYSVAFSPDGKRVLSGGYGKELTSWDVATGKAVFSVNEAHSATIVAFSPDGRFAVSSCMNVRDAETGAVVHEFGGHSLALAFSQDGALLACGGWEPRIRVFDMNTLKEVGSFEATVPVSAVAISPDKSLVIASGANGHADQIQMWNLKTQALVHPLNGHARDVVSVSMSADGLFLLSGSTDKTIRRWNVETQRVEKEYRLHRGPVQTVQLIDGGARAVSIGNDIPWGESGVEKYSKEPDVNKIKVWDVVTEKELFSWECKRAHETAVVATDDGEGIFAVESDEGNFIELWSLASGESIGQAHRRGMPRLKKMVFSPQGTRLFVSGITKAEMEAGGVLALRSGFFVWDLESATELVSSQTAHAVELVAFSGSGEKFALAENKDVEREDGEQSLLESIQNAKAAISVWDLKSKERVLKIRDIESPVRAIRFFDNDSLILTAHDDRCLRFWSVATGKCVRTIRNRMSAAENSSGSLVNDIVLFPKGDGFVTANANGTVSLYTKAD